MKRKTIGIIFIILILAVIIYGIYYVNDYYHAEESVNEYLDGNDNVNIINTSNGLLVDGPGNDTAIIFYPGAKVEYTSYLPLLSKIAENGVDCYDVEMPFNIAFLGINSADELIKTGNYSHYYIAGHSLGGVVAATYVNHTENCEGIILLASYPTEEINVPVLSIYGSEDGELNVEKYNESKPLMKNITEIIIKGGNHAQFGNYGNQSGDGVAEISKQSQQNITVKEILDFIKN